MHEKRDFNLFRIFNTGRGHKRPVAYSFTITLNFGDQLEKLKIPFLSIISFVDPSVEFGLKFDDQEEKERQTTKEAEMVTVESEDKNEAEIVSLDSFRK